jgi:lipopolysaccharide export system protein LptA
MARRWLPLLVLSALIAAGAAPAQQPQKLPASRDRPIEISAESLDVQQDKQVATFTGNVVAVQGDMRLKAPQLRVYYRQGGKAGDAPRGSPAAGAGNITRIEATGRVFLSAPSQTAEGDQGVYDAERNTITLNGNVVITQDRNVLRGARAVVDLGTGQARMDGRVFGRFEQQKEGRQ